MDENGNENCLKGLECPKCGHHSSFWIEAKGLVIVTDDGTDLADTEYDWDDDSPCLCVGCAYGGFVTDFRIAEEKPNENTETEDRSAVDAAL